MISQDQIDLPHLSTWIGREASVSDILTPELVRRFRSTFDLSPVQADIGEKAPRLIHLCLGQPGSLTSELGADGHPRKGGFLPPVPLPRRMWASGSIVFHRDLHVGDTVRRVSRITNVTAKTGRTGPLCFISLEHTILVDDQESLVEAQTIVYRSADEGGQTKPAAPAEEGSRQRRMVPSAPLLFRYSAITFNGHRIHYDRGYATSVEHYPGLVVHGPLQATLLYNFASEINDGIPASHFSFRSHTPLFDDDPFLLHAKQEKGRMSLWTARAGGPVGMAAEAKWT